MRKSLLAAFAVVAAIAAPSMAGAADGTVTVGGTVAVKCLFTSPSDTVTIPELALTTGAAANIGRLDTASVTAQSATLSGWCNGASSTISVTANPLENTSTAPTGFTNRIDYTAIATAHPASGNVVANDSTLVAGGSTPATVGIFASDIDIAFSSASAPSDALLVAGSYNGSVVVSLAPAI